MRLLSPNGANYYSLGQRPRLSPNGANYYSLGQRPRCRCL
ncbi:MAG: hypothetical protein DRR19_29060 [Candidatus Parabeggiatoa sp. nov. 1]|nr:MAG: hypothetical protein DRR19_29060 [Gammaproteobacteria bacterium]HEC84957.1 hypothetical protein [Thioploca sp.]